MSAFASQPRRSARIASMPPVHYAPVAAPRKASCSKEASIVWMTEKMIETEKIFETEELNRSYHMVLASSPLQMKWERSLDATSLWVYNVSPRLLLQSTEIRERSIDYFVEMHQLLHIAYDKKKYLDQQDGRLPSGEWADEIREDLETTYLLIHRAHVALDRWIKLMKLFHEKLDDSENPFSEKPAEDSDDE